MLLNGALDGTRAASGEGHRTGSDTDVDYADAVSALFRGVAISSGNRVLAGFVKRTSDRLHQMRTREHLVFSDLGQEMSNLDGALRDGPETAKAALLAYHERRFAVVGELVATLP